MPLFDPIARALSQFDDAVFKGVVWRSIGWSLLCAVGLTLLVMMALQHFVHGDGWQSKLAEILGLIGAVVVSACLFLPLAAGIGMLYLERIARAVEARFYPWLPPPAGETVVLQTWDSVVVSLKVAGLSIVALILALMLPVLGWALGWAISAYAIGRGLFVAVAMRRMPRVMAESVYVANRTSVLAQGAVLALAAYVPILNLLIPVVGTAAMVHVLDQAIARTTPPAGPQSFPPRNF